MTASKRRDDITTTGEFAAELEHIVAEAREENLPIEGAHNVRSPYPGDTAYTVEISAIADRNRRLGWQQGTADE